jgi:Xaa-Pro aminopeptidase
MHPNLSELSSVLADAGTDVYLFVTDDPDADQYYVSGFSAPDGVVSLYAPDADGGSVYVLTNELEYGRAESGSHADGVVVGSDLGYRELRREYDDDEARHRLLGRFLDRRGNRAGPDGPGCQRGRDGRR